MITLLITLFSLTPQPAQADWAPLIACDNYGMVVDRSSDGSSNQLVIRNNPDILSYFQSKADVRRAMNDKNEMIVSVSRGGPQIEHDNSALFVGYISGQTNVVVSWVDQNSVKVALWTAGYRGSNNVEVANWVFRNCSSR